MSNQKPIGLRAIFRKFVDRTIFLEQTNPRYPTRNWALGAIDPKKREMLARQVRPVIRKYFPDPELEKLVFSNEKAPEKVSAWALEKYKTPEKAIEELSKIKAKLIKAFEKQNRIVERITKQHEYVKQNYKNSEEYIGNIVHMIETGKFVIDIRLHLAILLLKKMKTQ